MLREAEHTLNVAFYIHVMEIGTFSVSPCLGIPTVMTL